MLWRKMALLIGIENGHQQSDKIPAIPEVDVIPRERGGAWFGQAANNGYRTIFHLRVINCSREI